jgi:hypothetical protein
MATHKANLNFYLYTGFDESASDGVQALAVLNESGIEFTHLHYFHSPQIEEVREWARKASENTEYSVPAASFPFVVYEKAFDTRDNPPREHVLVHGLSEILSTNWVELSAFEG